MVTITDKNQIDRLNEKQIVIEDIFSKKGNILIRSTDGIRCDQVFNATRVEKRYFHKNKCIFVEKNFDKNSNFTFATHSKDHKINCSNCGASGSIDKFYDGCPYCDTNFNIDYNLKRYGMSEFKAYINTKKIKNISLISASIITILVCIIQKITLPQILLSILAFPIILFFSYLVCSFFVFINLLSNIFSEIRLESKNFKNGKLDRNKLISHLIFELKNFYYNNEKYSNLIDFDIIKYERIEDFIINENLYVVFSYKIRKYFFKNGKIIKKINKEKVRLKCNYQTNNLNVHNIISCSNCGASIDISKKYCEYCKTKIESVKEWVLDKFY